MLSCDHLEPKYTEPEPIYGVGKTINSMLLSPPNVLWQTMFDGRFPLMEKLFCWKTNFDGKPLLMEEDPRWKTTFD